MLVLSRYEGPLGSRRHGLAGRQRAEEGAEGLTRVVPRTVAGLAVAFVLSAAMPALAHQPGRDARLPTIGAAPPFALTTADGGRLALGDLRGKVAAVTFIYATCTDTCPLLTGGVAEERHGHGSRASTRYSITFVAWRRTTCGIVIPSCLAVFRFTVRLNFIGCCTGRSAGCAPFKILSTYVAARRYMSSQSGP